MQRNWNYMESWTLFIFSNLNPRPRLSNHLSTRLLLFLALLDLQSKRGRENKRIFFIVAGGLWGHHSICPFMFSPVWCTGGRRGFYGAAIWVFIPLLLFLRIQVHVGLLVDGQLPYLLKPIFLMNPKHCGTALYGQLQAISDLSFFLHGPSHWRTLQWCL